MSEYETSSESVHNVVREFKHQISHYPRTPMLFPPSDDSSSLHSLHTSFLEEPCQSPTRHSTSAIEESEKMGKEKPFQCNFCVMSFTRPSDLQRHLLIHNNNKPYKCEECDREFTWFGNFQKHVLSHMGGSTRAPGTLPFSAMFTFLASEGSFYQGWGEVQVPIVHQGFYTPQRFEDPHTHAHWRKAIRL